MIELHDIIEAASKYIKKGTLILHRSMKVHPKFKVYKKFCYDLYKVVEGKNELVFSYEKTENSPSDNIEDIWDKCDKLYIEYFINWVSSDEYKAMRKDYVI